ncbi:MAG: RES family NAD+ phosphorylase [Gammaproteobacteria bacterium]|jgi:hypothetical protein
MDGLFDRNQDFDQTVVRNIVSLRESQPLFADLVDTAEEHDVLIAAEMRIKSDSAPGIIARGFHYTTAIEYPFKTEHFMASRYGDGSYPVWYGSLDLATTIYETAWHMRSELLCIEGLDEVVVRERAIYHIECRALLIDLSAKAANYPGLIDNDYSFTQQVGRRVQGEGHPGLLAPSARKSDGINSVIFREDVLSNPRFQCSLTYFYNPADSQIKIERTPGTTLMTIYSSSS